MSRTSICCGTERRRACQGRYIVGSLNSPFTEWSGDDLHGRHKVITHVWVDLGTLFYRPPDATRHVIETGLDLTGQVPGRLHGRFPSVDGVWCGVVDYEIPYADGRRSLPLVDQLLPFSVLRPQRTTRQ